MKFSLRPIISGGEMGIFKQNLMAGIKLILVMGWR